MKFFSRGMEIERKKEKDGFGLKIGLPISAKSRDKNG